MKAFVFAAGLGTRLRPLTDTMPKALVPINKRPLIDIVIDNLHNQGIDKFVVNVHHFADQIVQHLESRTDVQIEISDESDLLRNTGGAVKYAARMLGQTGRFLVHNVDIISNFSLQYLLSCHKVDSMATLLVSERNTERYLLFNKNMRLVGWTNIKTGEVRTPFKELRVNDCEKLAFSGIHVLDSRITSLMETEPEQFSIIDFYLKIAAEYPIYGCVQEDLRMIDVGKLNSLEQASQLLTQLNL